ncbi:LCP family protein [Nocardia sp. CNY236]|uniref:LCP family protein n=1 Tax=Nocardia sp. CNY236 TaxID=1169152 RepID=UPI00350EF6A3
MIGRAALTVLSVLVLVATGTGWSYLHSTTSGFTQVSALDDNSEDVIDSSAQLGDENFLLVGTDTRAGANGQLGAGSTIDAEGSRADTVMLVNIPKNRSRVVVVSFPRDLDVTRPRCNGWDNEKVEYTDEVFPSAFGDKLNAVYALGGPKCLFNVISKMTGLSINHFISIDFAGFEAMVDQVGGVDVCSAKPIVDGVLGTILENSGRQHISGETALNYVRARHVYGEERSDYDRINRQQRFLASLLRGTMSSKVLLDPGKLRGFIEEFTRHTWVDQVDTNDLLMLGRSLQKMDAGAVTFLTIPTAGTTSYGNEIPRESDIKAIFRAIIDDQPLPGEKKATPTESHPADPPEFVAVDPSTVSVLVSNGSGVNGMAGATATDLSNAGFTIYSTGNFSEGQVTETKIRYAPGYEAEAATAATAIPGAHLESADDLGGIIEVVLGTDFSGSVTSPIPAGDRITDVSVSIAPVTLPSDLEHMNAAEDICN